MANNSGDNNSVAYKCDKCDKSYKSTNSLISHTRIKHQKSISTKEILNRINLEKERNQNGLFSDDDSVSDEELRTALDDAEFDNLIGESNDLLSEAESIDSTRHCDECISKFESLKQQNEIVKKLTVRVLKLANEKAILVRKIRRSENANKKQENVQETSNTSNNVSSVPVVAEKSPVNADSEFVTKEDLSDFKKSLLKDIKLLVKTSNAEDNSNVIDISGENEEGGASSRLLCCDSCNFKTSSESQLRKHKISEHKQSNQTKNSYQTNKSSELLPCDACDFIAKGALAYSLHIKQHEIDLQFCDECDYSTKTSKLIQLHKESYHSKNPKIKCRECDFTANSHAILRKHNAIAMGHKKNIICKHFEKNQCKFGFNCKFLHKSTNNKHHNQNLAVQPPYLMNNSQLAPAHQPSVVFVDRNINRYNTSLYQGNGLMEGVLRPSYLLQ